MFVRSVGTSLTIAAVAALMLYPLVVYAVIGRFGATGVAAVLAGACVARLVVLKLRGGPSFGDVYVVLVCAGGVALAAASYWLDNSVAVLYYPVLVNAVLFGVFAASLARPPSVIERIARLREPDLPPAAVVYTRRVTVVWTVFFVLNGGAAWYTAVFASLETWALYNGLIAYLLIAGLFVVELAVRAVVRARLAP